MFESADILLWGLYGTIFAVYLTTLSPSIAGGDSGELVAEGCALGTAHPPGYPLLTLIIYFLQWIPFESVAYKVNVLSACLTTVAAWGIAETVKTVSYSKSTLPGAVLAAGAFSFSPLIWQYAVTAEVFPLNTMFAAILVYLTAKFGKSGDVKLSMLGAFVCGLAMCNQHTIVLYVVPLTLWILVLQRHRFMRAPYLLIWHGVLVLLGFSFYFYLPIASFYNPTAGSWGEVTTLSGFLHHFLRKDYGTFQLFSGNGGKKTEGFYVRTMAYLTDATYSQGLYIVPALAMLAALVMCMRLVTGLGGNKIFGSRSGRSTTSAFSVAVKKSSRKKKHAGVTEAEAASGDGDVPRRGEGTDPTAEAREISIGEASHTPCVLAGTLVFYFLVFHSLSNLPLSDKLLYGVHQRFWMQPNVILFTFGGIGYNYVTDWMCSCLYIISGNDKKGSSDGERPPTASRRALDHTVGIVSLCCAVAACVMQWYGSYGMADQSQARYFQNYAQALLDPLPQSSLLLINYDMQWTSVRYMQKCEGLRPDVTVINLSMMTYQWFKSKRSLYPHLVFPGEYHSYENSPAVRSKVAFTISQFVDANIDSIPIFLSGKLSFRDSVFESRYDHIPYGLVSRIERVEKLPNGTSYAPIVRKAWQTVHSHLSRLPDSSQYPEETWEWTIGRDFKDRLTDTAAFYLEAALKVASADYKPLLSAVYMLESAIALERSIEGGSPSTALLKNTGLAHVNLVQNKLLRKGKPLPRPMGDVLNTTSLIKWPQTEEWAKWSTGRFVSTWGEFLERPDARADPQFERIRQMYTTAVS